MVRYQMSSLRRKRHKERRLKYKSRDFATVASFLAQYEEASANSSCKDIWSLRSVVRRSSQSRRLSGLLVLADGSLFTSMTD